MPQHLNKRSAIFWLPAALQRTQHIWEEPPSGYVSYGNDACSAATILIQQRHSAKDLPTTVATWS